MDENLFVKLVGDIEALDKLTDEDKDLMRKLVRKVEEIESESRNSN